MKKKTAIYVVFSLFVLLNSVSVFAGLPLSVTRVEDVSHTCMVFDEFIDERQRPVEISGKTYYTCCHECLSSIKEDPSVRYGIDPVTGRSVDKSGAIIARDDEGELLYFESEATFGAFMANKKSVVQRVEDVSHTCMVVNKYVGVKQIALEVSGKIYHVCCKICSAKIRKYPSLRYGIDPVSGHRVDKSKAVIARDESGKLLYFESEDSFDLFIAK